jgi:methionyl aminopeptidase
MRPSLPRLKVIANQFGTYELIHPPPAPSKHLIHLPRRYHPPLDVPPHIDRPSYVPRNWFTRRKADEKIEQGQEEGTEEARIALGGEEERGVRQAGRLVAEVMSLVEPMIQVRRLKWGSNPL